MYRYITVLLKRDEIFVSSIYEKKTAALIDICNCYKPVKKNNQKHI